MEKLRKFLNGLTKEGRTAFATACITTENYLRKAISTKQKLGVELCISIERESNRVVTCEDLNPDADWAFIRNSGVVTTPSESDKCSLPEVSPT